MSIRLLHRLLSIGAGLLFSLNLMAEDGFEKPLRRREGSRRPASSSSVNQKEFKPRYLKEDNSHPISQWVLSLEMNSVVKNLGSSLIMAKTGYFFDYTAIYLGLYTLSANYGSLRAETPSDFSSPDDGELLVERSDANRWKASGFSVGAALFSNGFQATTLSWKWFMEGELLFGQGTEASNPAKYRTHLITAKAGLMTSLSEQKKIYLKSHIGTGWGVLQSSEFVGDYSRLPVVLDFMGLGLATFF